MKRLAVCVLVVAALLSGCDALGIGNKFVGTWTCETIGTVTYAFRSDMTFTHSGDGFDGPYAETGTYEYTGERLTLTYDDGGTNDMLYEFRDGLLVLTATGGIGISLVLSPVE